MKKIIRVVLVVLLILLVLIQFKRPQKNISTNVASDISTKYPMPPNVDSTLKVACYDCHSNNSAYPWYWRFQPVAWFMDGHIKEGKKHLNFSEFTNYTIFKQYGKLKQMNDEVKSGDMPLTSYALIHTNALLTDQQKRELAAWVQATRKQIENNYPADSLVKKKQQAVYH